MNYRQIISERLEQSKGITNFEELKQMEIHGNAYGDYPIFHAERRLLRNNQIPTSEKLAIMDYVAREVMGIDCDDHTEKDLNEYLSMGG